MCTDEQGVLLSDSQKNLGPRFLGFGRRTSFELYASEAPSGAIKLDVEGG